MTKYNLQGEKFHIEDYDKAPAFSSFLPGLAGVKGIPVWVFYTNRGQGINSFGIDNKNNAIMEFNPANTAYENTPVKGFRTFIRSNQEFFEPFCGYNAKAKREMSIEKNKFSIEETNQYGLKMRVEYVVLPNESIGALVRKVVIENTSAEEKSLEVIDGMTKIIPYGVHNNEYKEMSNLLKSWTELKNIENDVPFYTMRASSDDSAEVSEVEGGYYYCTVLEGKKVPIIYDPDVVFEYDNSLVTPVRFKEEGLDAVLAVKQCYSNKIPCGMTPIKKTLKAGESLEFASFIGYSGSISHLNDMVKTFCKPGYADEKIRESVVLLDSFVKDVYTKTASPLFDQYMEQCYLDNFLRGGYPFVFNKDGNRSIVHLFSRKHGDPERDYNFFSIAGEYYSQGNGNYRDVCQNRRNDVFFNRDVEDFNVRNFYNLVQMDGYNPLGISPTTFAIGEENMATAKTLLAKYVDDSEKRLEKLIEKSFTPGQISNMIADHGMTLKGDENELVEGLLELSEQQFEANFGEGYWSDHFDYDLDLIENYLRIYPDKKEELLHGKDNYRYFDSEGRVRPRKDTYVINNGKVRQYGSMFEDKNKKHGTNWLKDEAGKYATTTLFGKLLVLAMNKFSLLDPMGMGVEMEGGKPGWNDAMNGLPGLFGSSMPETFELKRIIDFIVEELRSNCLSISEMELQEEPVDFLRKIGAALNENLSDFAYWDKVAGYREDFREQIKYTVTGNKKSISTKELLDIFTAISAKLKAGIDKAWEEGKGIMPTYFTYEATKYTEVKDQDGKAVISPYGLPSVTVQEFKLQHVPAFLEGPAKMLSSATPEQRDTLIEMFKKVQESDIYDKELKMYKTSESIEDVSMEHGRVRAFTPGWLERESVFLHMEYKYFLGLMKAGLYDEYYQSIQDALIPFQAPERYGRSILENSSFIASSVNPDDNVHGRGFVSRLSGSTTEMLSMWIEMFVGDGGFGVDQDELIFSLAPKLAGWLFDENGEAAFKLCSTCMVTYQNETGKNTYGTDGAKVVSMIIKYTDHAETIESNVVRGKIAKDIRDGKVVSIKAILK